MTHDEETPRIFARGEWYQDEYGETTYVPAHIRPSYLDDLEAERRQQEEDEADNTLDQPAPLGVWANPPEPRLKNQRTDDTWEAIRTDYLTREAETLGKEAIHNLDHLTPADRTRIEARLTAILTELGQT